MRDHLANTRTLLAWLRLALLLMGFLEASRYSIYLLHALGIVLVIQIGAIAAGW